MSKVAIYVRLSREDRNKASASDDSESIINQRLMLFEACQKLGLEIYKIYCDEDYSGSDYDRPEFNKLLKDAENKKFDVILCKTQSRFARDVQLVEKYINTLFPIWGIRFISLIDNADSDNTSNRKSRQINSLIDQWYLEELSANIKRTLESKRKNGKWVGAFAPYGYIKDPADKNHLIIDEEAAEVVRYIYSLYLQGYGISAIAQRLNDEKIPNPATYKKQHGQSFQCSHRDCSDIWHTYSISRILSDELYIGNLVQGKSENVSYKSKKKRQKPKEEWNIVEGTHEAIIDKPTWEMVQKLRASKPKSENRGKQSVFARKLRCLGCGSSMRSWKTKGERYFRCNTRFYAKDRCLKSAYISEKVLTEYVITQIRELYDKYLDADIVEKKIVLKERVQDKINKYKAKINTVTNEIKKLDNRLNTMYYDKADGVITNEEYFSRSADCKEQKETQLKLKDEFSNKIAELEAQQNDSERIVNLIKSYRKLETLDVLTVTTLIDYIEIGGSKNNRIINIHWNF